MSMRVSRRLSTVATVVALAIPTIASAHAGNNDPNVVHACISNGSKAVRIVGVSGSCLAAETPTHWDIQGPQGEPGTDGTDGTNGTNGIDGTSVTLPAPPCFDNTNRYVNCGNGTVTDTVTGLIWLQQADCLADANYSAANQAAAALKDGDCGGNLTDKSSPGDWRLPTKDEWSATLARALALGCVTPTLTNDAGTGCFAVGAGSSFAGVALDHYWSSSTNESLPSSAWHGSLSVAPPDDDVVLVRVKVGTFGTLRVWPVRGGPR